MYPRYFALRRVNPYRGVLQMVEAGDATAYSQDGLSWHIRSDDGYGWVRPSGIWIEGKGLVAGQAKDLGDILAALDGRPALPFPFFDTQELWLLDKESGLPLALLATDRATAEHAEQPSADWYPFVQTYNGFHSSTLTQRAEAGARHRDFLTRQVNNAAKPYAAAQWFQRNQAGEGSGGYGLRIPSEWRGRQLPAAGFPELIVRETWNSRLEKSVIDDYHAWLAPILLLWPRLSTATRARLESLACEKPRWLARVHRLLPTMLDAPRLKAALVAARLEESADNLEQDWN